MKNHRSRHSGRPGTILVVALVMLTFVILLSAALTKSVAMFHRQAQFDERRHQAVLLAESAVLRATRAVATVSEYQGETWKVPADSLGDGPDGIVVIRVEKPTAGTGQRRLVVEASYPADGPQRFVFRRELWVESPTPSTAPPAAPATSSS